MNFLELCQQAVAIDSTHRCGNKEIAAFYSALAQDFGFEVELHEGMYSGVAQSLLLVRPENISATKELAMVSQLDTPNPGDFVRWTKTGGNPFSTVLSGDTLYGLGVARGKIDFLIKLLALKEMKSHDFKQRTPVLLGSYGGEMGAGALRAIRKKSMKPDLALVSSPTALNLAVEGPGYATLEVFVPFSEQEKKLHKESEFAENITTETKMFAPKKVKNRIAEHEDTPIGQMLHYLKNMPEGILLMSLSGGEGPNQQADSTWLEFQVMDQVEDSIIRKLLDLNETLRRFTGEMRLIKDDRFFPNNSNINIGAVRTRTNGVYFLCSCRFVPGVSKTKILQWLEVFENECQQKGAEYQLLEYREPYRVKDSSELYPLSKELLNELDIKGKEVSTQWCNDANVLKRFGVDTVIVGAGELSPSQALGTESININDVDKLKAFYQKAIERLCQ